MNNLNLPAPNVEFPEYPKYPEKLHMSYYKAPLIDVKECLTNDERNALMDIKAAKNGSQMIEALKAFIECMKGRNQHFVCSRVEFTTLPSSIMLDLLIPTEDGVATDIADVKYDLDLRLSGLVRKYSSPAQKIYINNLIEKANKIFIKKLLSHGIKAVLEEGEEGFACQFSFFTSPPAGLKKMSAYFLSTEAWQIPSIKTASWFGLSPTEMNKLTKGKIVFPKQIMQMRGLYTSSAIPTSKFFNDGRKVDPKKVIVMPKAKRTLSGWVNEVRGLYDQKEVYRTDLDRAFGDGQSIGNPRKFGKLACQLRFMGFKGLMCCFDVVAWAQYRGIDPVVTDIYGVKHNLAEEDWDLLTTLDSWKLGKVFPHWNDCVAAAEKIGLTEFYICAMNSVEKKTVNVARQCWNSLFAITNKQLFPFIKPMLDKINKADELEGAAALLREDFAEELTDKTGLAQCLALDSHWLALGAIFRKAAQIKESRWCKVAGGSVKMPGVSAYLIDDPALMCDAWLGIDINNDYAGLLRPGQVFVPDCHRASGKITLLRYPHAYMEWAILNLVNNAWLRQWLPEHVCVINGHDLTPRILMFDVDGDHATIVFSEALAEIADAIKKRFHIIPLYYDPKSAEGKPVGESRNEFIDQAVECIVKCKEYNMVGPYSNVVRTVWSIITTDAEQIMKDGLDAVVYEYGDDEVVTVRDLLRAAAYAAQKVNEAVDSQKTYALDFIDEDFEEQYSGTPYNQRFRDHSPKDIKNPETGLYTSKRWDSPEWAKDKRAMDPMNGTVDRIVELCMKYSDVKLKLDASQLELDWELFLDDRYLTGYQPRKMAITEDLYQQLRLIGRANTDHAACIMQDLQNGNAKFEDLLHLCHMLYGESFSVFTKNEDDEIAKSAHYIDEIARIQDIVANYFALSEKYASMSYDEALHAAGNSALRTVIRLAQQDNPNDDKFILFCFDVFGEVWAENAENNAL